MNINMENLQFLSGFLNALSSIDRDIGDYTMTAIVIENSNNNLLSSIVGFYDLPYDQKSLDFKKIKFYDMEKIISFKILQKPFNNSSNYDKNRNNILSYKIMDYIQFCFEDFINVNINDIEVFNIKLNFEKYRTEFLAIPIDECKNIFLLSFWAKSH